MREITSCLWLSLICLTIIFSIIQAKDSLKPPANEKLKLVKLPPCAACKVLIESFKRNFEATKKGKFEGGDAAWEEDKQKPYARSEVRLIEIQEKLCKDVEKGEIQCLDLAEELESSIEDWWFKHQDAYPDIYVYICIKIAKKCCPKDHFGPECEKCSGYPDKVCNNNGKCKGSGTRKGNGRCSCDKGYAGDDCSQCDAKYYKSYKDENKLLCSKCHAACADGCSNTGAVNCQGECQPGWKKADKGCVDVNECLEIKNVCSKDHFCVNNDGNFSCLNCDQACDGCNGDGPDMCFKCAEGYQKKDNICINADIFGRKQHENMARYARYFGLAVATCIILQKNVYAASAIGVLVALYISISEYTLANSEQPTPNLDMLSPIN